MTIWINGHTIFAYNLAPDYDFKQDIISFGDTVEVLAPVSFRNSIAETVKKLNNQYN